MYANERYEWTAKDISIRIESCIDSDEFVWSLLDQYGSVICDGYSATREDAMTDAKERREYEVEWLNDNNQE